MDQTNNNNPARTNEDGTKIPINFRISKSNEILNMVAKEVPFVINRMIAEKTITAITAKSGVGKSLFALILAKHISKGENLFGEFGVKQKKVLIIDQEMPDDILIERYKAIVKEMCDVDYIWEQSWLIEDEEHFEWLRQTIEENEYGVIIFDMLDGIHEKNENDNSEMKVINKKLLRLINKTGVSVIVLHQHRKEDNRTKSSQDSAQGAGEIIHKATSHLIIEKTGDKEVNEFGEERIEYLLKQEKSRRPETMQSFKFNVYYSEKKKETFWEFGSYHDEKLVAIEQARNAIVKFLSENQGIWYLGSKKYPDSDMLKVIKEMTGIKDKNIRNAAQSLAKEEIISSMGKSPIGYFKE